MKTFLALVILAAIALLAACASLFGSASHAPALDAPAPSFEETPAGKVASELAHFTEAINLAIEDGVVTEEEAGKMSVALRGLSTTMVDAVRDIESGLRAEIRQAQSQGGGVDWPSTLLQVGISALLGGATGFQIVRKAPNRSFLGVEPDPDVARAAGLAAPEIVAPPKG